jgi:Lrp/AsnC family transcriptional regulator, regulator of ectoine-degradation genes
MARRTRSGPALDPTDLKLLEIIQTQGRISNLSLARMVNLSESACFQRVRRLEKAGVIAYYQAVISYKALGPVVTIFVHVTLDNQRPKDYAAFEALLADVPEVVEAHVATGGHDYILKVVVRELSHYVELFQQLAVKHSNIRQYFSYVVMREAKSTPPSLKALIKIPN